MDKKTLDEILKNATYSIQKPRKAQRDRVFMVAGVLIAGVTKGDDWVNESLKKLGWNRPITPGEKALILSEAERLIHES